MPARVVVEVAEDVRKSKRRCTYDDAVVIRLTDAARHVGSVNAATQNNAVQGNQFHSSNMVAAL